MTPAEAAEYKPLCPICHRPMAEEHRRMSPLMNKSPRYLYFTWACRSVVIDGNSHSVTITKKSDTP